MSSFAMSVSSVLSSRPQSVQSKSSPIFHTPAEKVKIPRIGIASQVRRRFISIIETGSMTRYVRFSSGRFSYRTAKSKSRIPMEVDCLSFSRIKVVVSHICIQMEVYLTTQRRIRCPWRYANDSHKYQLSLNIWWRIMQIHINIRRYCHHLVRTHALRLIENVHNNQRHPHRTWDTSDDKPFFRNDNL